MRRPNYYKKMLLYVDSLSCPMLKQLKDAIKEIERIRKKRVEKYGFDTKG